jgi:hypothetical protein
VALLRGDAQLALAYYDRAARIDSLDPGIGLDRALALESAGQDSAAQAHLADAVGRAGGPEEAGALLGMRPETANQATEPERAAAGAGLTRQEVWAKLRDSVRRVPDDSSRATTSKPRTKDSSRFAGPRAADAQGPVLYWKR